MTDTAQDIGTDPTDPYIAGDTLRITETITEPDGSPKNLTGATVEWAVARYATESPVLDASDADVTLDVTDAAAGIVTVAVAADVTADMNGEYIHEFRVTDQAGDQDTVTRGTLDVTTGVVA